VAGFRAAVAYFQQATARQPDFAMAYARMAEAQLQLVYAGQFAPRDIVPQADAAAQRALALDDTVSLAHFTRSEILQDYYWQWEASDHELRRALELDATTRNARTRRAFADLRLGRVEDAIDAAQEVRAADPLSAQGTMNLATILRATGRFDEALAHLRGMLARDEQIPRGHFQLGVTYAFMERWSDAIDALHRALQLTPANTRFEAYLGFALAKAGRLAEARDILDDLHARSKNQYVSSFGIALIDDALGEHEAAVAALGRAYDDHALEFSQWYQYPHFKAVEADPRYQAFWPRMKRTP
jgi:tetratricopeptide (TPR) repeat protein